MNKVVNKFLLTADKFMPEAHLRDYIVDTYSACNLFTILEKRIQNFIKSGDTNYIYKNDLDKACFSHDAAYNKYKDLKKKNSC